MSAAKSGGNAFAAFQELHQQSRQAFGIPLGIITRQNCNILVCCRARRSAISAHALTLVISIKTSSRHVLCTGTGAYVSIISPIAS
jgi:hypothetical protein